MAVMARWEGKLNNGYVNRESQNDHNFAGRHSGSEVGQSLQSTSCQVHGDN